MKKCRTLNRCKIRALDRSKTAQFDECLGGSFRGSRHEVCHFCGEGYAYAEYCTTHHLRAVSAVSRSPASNPVFLTTWAIGQGRPIKGHLFRHHHTPYGEANSRSMRRKRFRTIRPSSDFSLPQRCCVRRLHSARQRIKYYDLDGQSIR